MAKAKALYVCNECGAKTAKWAGRCDSCSSWNSLTQEIPSAPVTSGGGRPGKGIVVALETLQSGVSPPQRMLSGIGELDRVTGGGFVPGSALLIGGEPGIGKSTLLVQTGAELSRQGQRVIYISGEEATDQVRLRAARLGLDRADISIIADTSIENILTTLEQTPRPDLLIIDSIQTLWTSQVESAPGTVSQLRAASQLIIRYAKLSGACVVLVGHVTKDGQIAGPRVVEHMVDGVIYFESESQRDFRLLRAVKNRFGPTDEIGVFSMTARGLEEVSNPSALFLGERDQETTGSAVLAAIEGSRPVLVEIQALVASSHLGNPRRAVVGWDSNRLSMILAVLEARCRLQFGSQDVFLNIAGGLKIKEPAADLAVAAALISSLAGKPIANDAIYFGEIGLSGAVRAVGQIGARLKEAEKLGFKTAFIPETSLRAAKTESDLKLIGLTHLMSLVETLAI